MTELATFAALLGVVMVGGVEDVETGVGAYYHESADLMRQVCERRVAHGWHPEGVRLDCDFPCLAAAIEPRD